MSTNPRKKSDPTELYQWLRDVASKFKTIAQEPSEMAIWIREATDIANINRQSHFHQWFDMFGKSGAGSERADMVLLDEVKRAVKKHGHSSHLFAKMEAKEKAVQRASKDITGRHALLMVRG